MQDPASKRGKAHSGRYSLGELNQRWQWVIPTLLLSATAAWLYLPDVLFMGPRGIHFIRQTDSLSFALSLVHQGAIPTELSIQSIIEAPDDGRVMAEFPLTYWICARGWSITSIWFPLLRWVHLLIVMLGHLAVAVTIGRMVRNIWIGTLLSTWSFASSVTVAYAANYLPDAAAYGLVLCGIAKALESEKTGPSCIASFLFSFATAIKATMGIYFLAYIGVYWSRWIFGERSGFSVRPTLIASLMLLPALAWHGFVITFNASHNTHYFLTWAEPVWAMSMEQIWSTIDHVWNYWWTKYMHPTSWHVLMVFALITMVNIGKFRPDRRTWLLLSIAGSSMYILLFFNKLQDHDYYYLTVAPTLLLLVAIAMITLHDRWSAVRVRFLVTFGLLVLTLISLQLAKTNLDRRYAPNYDRYARVAGRLDKVPMRELRSLIPIGARCIVVGDATPNASLLYIDRKGWTFEELPSERKITELRSEGAQYLIVLEPQRTINERASGDYLELSMDCWIRSLNN